jgi:excisionase family DNA binding protein
MPTEWLSLNKAAEILGVHPSTVRNWSNQGILPVHRTQGGHRRFLRSEIELWMLSRRDETAEFNLVVQNALRNTRFQISDGRLNVETWYAKLDEEARTQYRLSGRSLLQGLIVAINSPGRLDITEAEALGYSYAARAHRYGLNSVEATQAFLFFRNALIESTLVIFETALISTPRVWAEMIRRMTEFTDRILITILEVYESYSALPS